MADSEAQANLKKLVDDITGLPTLPAVITQVTKMLQNPKVSANEVGQAISSDQALATKILKVVNSPFYGFPSRIKTITHAIVILGFNAVKATALSASVFSTLGSSEEGSGFDREAFWKHSLAVGAAGKVIASRLQLKETEEAFLAGLMHDIGKVILDQYIHEKFGIILNVVKEKGLLIQDAEREVLDGVSHTEIGSWLAKKWHLNEEFIAVIENHHAPSSAKPCFELTCIVHVANVFARCLDIGNSGDDNIPIINPVAWELVKIKNEELPDVFKEISAEVEKTEVFFQFSK